ncbi:MAG: hypothetical protein SangKO_037540 [Sandaracinaceae bacterium]
MSKIARSLTLRLGLLSSLLVLASLAKADSVAQIASAVRINRGTATLIDPQGRPGMMGMGSRTAVRPGDILTFTAAFTPVPNGGVRGLGGYVTVYVPRNTEVVGARFIDSRGRTVAPHRGGLGAEGTGPRGSVTLTARTGLSPETTMEMFGGSMSQLHADTGIFYASDPRLARVPNGPTPSEIFITLHNGILMSPQPTAYGQLNGRLGSSMPYAHNTWDVIQAYGFGVGGAALGTGGRGNTPDLYGSPVAGPDSFYTFEATLPAGFVLDVDNVIADGQVGPWRRMQVLGAEIGRRGVAPPVPDPGPATRIGIPALDAMGRPLGARVDADNPLPGFDAARPADPYVRALRFAVGELVVGEEYLSEFSLRVLDTPLDPASGTDTVCAEVFGGDASAESPGGNNDGKDNAWRYFLPAPACVDLGLLFDLDVSHLVILPGGTLTYTITAKNLSTRAHTDVLVSHCFDGSVRFRSATLGYTRDASPECAGDSVEWVIPRLDPGMEETFTLEFEARGGETTGRAVFTSNELVSPGFSTIAYTNIGELVIMDFDATATPAEVATPPGTVRYAVRLNNIGSGDASAGCGDCQARVTLPSGFVFAGGATVDGAAATPTVSGDDVIFDPIPNIPAGGTVTLELDVTIPAGHPEGVYTLAVDTWLNAGETINDSEAGLAPVVVGTRSEPPMVDGPLTNGATMVCGTSSEAPGSVVRIYYGGVEAAQGTVGAGGRWCVTVPTLYPGLAVSATVQASGELESEPSAEETVVTVTGAACGDGIDNDGDGLIDFPEDPECDSPDDIDEDRHAQCADGVDNDEDGLTDYGEDPGCSSLTDDDESGPPACMNGVDDDGDGRTDFPDDPGCASADDVSERALPQCANGLDDDGDGDVDYPLDRGCASAIDDDETAASSAPLDGGVSPGDDGGAGADGGGIRLDGGTEFPDPGGVDRPTDGCGCRVTGAPGAPHALWLAALAALALRRRRG